MHKNFSMIIIFLMITHSSQSFGNTSSIEISSALDTSILQLAQESGTQAVVDAANGIPGNGSFEISEIPIQLSPASDGSMGVIALNSYNNGISSVELNVDIKNPTSIYTVANSLGGTVGVDLATITFISANFGSYQYTYTEGSNIRDWYNPGVGFHYDDVLGTQTYGNAVLDVQQIDLPTAFFTDSITEIMITSNSSWDNFGTGAPFFSAISYETAEPSSVPEPSIWSLMIMGFGLAGASLRRSRTMTLIA